MKSKKIKKYIKYLSKLLNKDPRFIYEQEYKYQTKLQYLHTNSLIDISNNTDNKLSDLIDNQINNEIDITHIINSKSNVYKKKYNDLLKIHNEHLKDEMKTLNTIYSQDEEKYKIIANLLRKLSLS
jgi:hypothetical protein